MIKIIRTYKTADATVKTKAMLWKDSYCGAKVLLIQSTLTEHFN